MAQPIAPDYGQPFLFPPALEDWVPALSPGLLLKIWLYGYFHRLRSTRKLEAACRELLPLVWLTGLIAPDHNSLWRFWRENKRALRAVFQQTVQVALRTGAVGLALQALDGTKIEAARPADRELAAPPAVRARRQRLQQPAGAAIHARRPERSRRCWAACGNSGGGLDPGSVADGR